MSGKVCVDDAGILHVLKTKAAGDEPAASRSTLHFED
jgi:hypothetical protein